MPDMSSDIDINAESPLESIIDAGRSNILACSFDYVHVHTNCSDKLAHGDLTGKELFLQELLNYDAYMN